MNHLRGFQNGCGNQAKTVDMIQSTLPNSETLFFKALKRVMCSYA